VEAGTRGTCKSLRGVYPGKSERAEETPGVGSVKDDLSTVVWSGRRCHHMRDDCLRYAGIDGENPF
jgi:hypothetical protein